MPRKAISKVRSNPIVKKPVEYSLDWSQPIEDEVIDIADFVDFLKQNLKIDGKKGNLSAVEISNTESKVTLSTTNVFSKKYVKYLTKKYLKKQDLRDYLRVIADPKLGYVIKFVDVNDGGDDEEDA